MSSSKIVEYSDSEDEEKIVDEIVHHEDSEEILNDNLALSGKELKKLVEENLFINCHPCELRNFDIDRLETYSCNLALCPEAEGIYHWIVITNHGNDIYTYMDTYGRSIPEIVNDYKIDLPADLIAANSKIQNDYTVVCGYYCYLWLQHVVDTDFRSTSWNRFVVVNDNNNIFNTNVTLFNEYMCLKIFKDNVRQLSKRLQHALINV